jgi:hypothetical protein
VQLHERVDDADRVALAHGLVDEDVRLGAELLADRLRQGPLDLVVVDDPPDRREHVLRTVAWPVLGQVVQAHDAGLVRELGLLRRAVHVWARAALLLVPLAREQHLLELGQLRLIHP